MKHGFQTIATYVKRWTISRLIRLLIGVFIGIEGVYSGNYVLTGLIGGYLLYTALFNKGCYTGACTLTHYTTSGQSKSDDY